MSCSARALMILAAAVLLASLVVGCGGGVVGTEEPGEAVREVLKAVEDRDAERWASLFVDGGPEEVEIAEDFFQVFESIKITIVRIEVVSQSDSSAEVAMVYDADMVMGGETFATHVDEVVEVVKVNDRWLVKEPFGE
jgi:hypothetical protein